MLRSASTESSIAIRSKPIDAIDAKILKLLAMEGRLPATEIARRVGLSDPPLPSFESGNLKTEAASWAVSPS